MRPEALTLSNLRGREEGDLKHTWPAGSRNVQMFFHTEQHCLMVRTMKSREWAMLTFNSLLVAREAAYFMRDKLFKDESIPQQHQQINNWPDVFILQNPPTSPRWQRGTLGGKPSCPRKSPAAPKTPPLAQTMTHLLKTGKKTQILRPRRLLATRPALSTSPTKAPTTTMTLTTR